MYWALSMFSNPVGWYQKFDIAVDPKVYNNIYSYIAIFTFKMGQSRGGYEQEHSIYFEGSPYKLCK